MSKPQTKPIPDGMHTVTPHLVFAGAAEAIELGRCRDRKGGCSML